jgi:hypothetical protein
MGTKGQTPKGNQLSEVIKYLSDNNVIDVLKSMSKKSEVFVGRFKNFLILIMGSTVLMIICLPISAGASQLLPLKEYSKMLVNSSVVYKGVLSLARRVYCNNLEKQR